MSLEKLEEIEKCINAYIQKDMYRLSIGKEHKFEEKHDKEKQDKKSEMLLECTINADHEMLSIHNLEGDKKFGHLKCRNCADGVLLDINHSNNAYRMIVVELKTTINEDELRKIPNQFLGAILRTFTLLTPTELRDHTIKFCVLFSNEKFDKSREHSKESYVARMESKNNENLKLWQSDKLRTNSFSNLQKKSICIKNGCIHIIKKPVKNADKLCFNEILN